jgi:hypothetical protein
MDNTNSHKNMSDIECFKKVLLPQTFKLFGIPICRLWAYQANVIFAALLQLYGVIKELTEIHVYMKRYYAQNVLRSKLLHVKKTSVFFSHGPNKASLVPDSCRATERNGNSIRHHRWHHWKQFSVIFRQLILTQFWVNIQNTYFVGKYIIYLYKL